MAKVTISIGLTDAEIKALSAMQISENESLNHTATRLLQGILGQTKAGLALSNGDEIKEIVKQQVNALAASTPDGEEIKQVIRQELAEAIAQIKGLIDERNGGVALPKQEAISVEQQVLPDYSAIRENILSQMKTGKQSAAKAIDAFIESLGAVKKEQQLAIVELDVAS
jgi:DNA-binding transcriptional MerR regulator